VDARRSSVEERLDRQLARLRAGANRWASLPVSRKIELLTACRDATGRVARAWAARGAALKGVSGTPAAGEEAITGPWAVAAALNRYISTLRRSERAGAPQLDRPAIRRRSDGQIVVGVFPEDLPGRFLLPGVRAEVWLRPGATPAALRLDPEPCVAAVLGAGNITSIGPLDSLYALVAEGAACVLKLHPLLDDLAAIVEEALAPLASEGCLAVVRGDAAAGAYLCGHPVVDRVHVTGSFATYERVVAEAGSEKLVTGELGNVTPTIVVPDRWSDADIAAAAANIVSAKLHNAGFNCVAPQVLILPAQWDRRSALLSRIERLLRDAPDRPAYYPGAAERFARLTEPHRARRYGRSGDGYVPRAIVELAADDPAEPLFREEAFCTLLAVVTLPGPPESYLENAVAFAGERLAGDLAVNVIARRRTPALDSAIAALRYGCVSLNAWSGVGFLLPQVPWGAYRGDDRKARSSGRGVVHNSRLLAATQKAVIYAPFAPFPKPSWYVTNRNQAAIAEALCDFEVARSPATLAKIALLGVTG
jgi:aldehyde dehydrogenase (NAD(P)+)